MTKLKGKILAGKVLVKPDEAEAKTASGLFIPDSAQEKPRKGVVVLVGAAKKDEPMEVKAGDLVAYALANKAFPALQDAVNGKTVIQPLNCIIDANFVNGDVTDLLGAWLGYGVSVINVPTATPDAEENGGGE